MSSPSTTVVTTTEKTRAPARRGAKADILTLLETHAAQIKALAPKGVEPAHYIASLQLAFAKEPKLLECSPGSIAQGILRVAQTGLDLGVSCDLLPFKGVAQFNVRYNGIVELALAAGTRAINSDVVRQGEDFEIRKGTASFLRHQPQGNVKARILGAYAIAEVKPGSYAMEYVSREQVEERKEKYSHSWKTTVLETIPWYARKCAIRTLAPLLPKNARFASALTFVQESEDRGQDDERPLLEALPRDTRTDCDECGGERGHHDPDCSRYSDGDDELPI